MAPKVGEKGPAKKGPAKKAADGKKKKKVSKAETYKIYIYSERSIGRRRRGGGKGLSAPPIAAERSRSRAVVERRRSSASLCAALRRPSRPLVPCDPAADPSLPLAPRPSGVSLQPIEDLSIASIVTATPERGRADPERGAQQRAGRRRLLLLLARSPAPASRGPDSPRSVDGGSLTSQVRPVHHREEGIGGASARAPRRRPPPAARGRVIA